MCTLNSNKIKESLDLLAEYCLTDTGILYILLQIKQCHAVLCSHEKYMKYIHTVVSSNILQTVANLTHTLTKAVQNCGMPADSGDLAHHWSVALCAFLFFFLQQELLRPHFLFLQRHQHYTKEKQGANGSGTTRHPKRLCRPLCAAA